MPDAIPVINLTPLREGGLMGLRRVALDIGAACRGTGCFYVTGHGVSPDLLSAAFEASRQLFSAPDEVKRGALYDAQGNRGYVPMQGEALDPGRPADLKEAFNIGLELPPDDPEIKAGALFRGLNRWPDVPGFRDTMLAYFKACQKLGGELHRAFAVDLGLQPDHFAGKIDRPMAVLRLLRYPPAPAHIEAGQVGAGEHTDHGCVTLLATDGVGGLQVRTRAGQWLDAPHIPDALLCNIGDCMMRWTNDIYVSTPHRVVSPPGRERYSIAFFFDPNPSANIACLPGCATPGRPAKYAPIRGDEFLLSRLSPTYEQSGLGAGQA